MNNKGIITTYVLVFGAIFLLLLSGLLGFILLQLRQTAQKVAWHESLQIAEAGINYYRWCLNNEVEGSCQLERELKDIAEKSIGKVLLEITSSISCGTTTAREIVATGQTDKFPQVKRKIKVSYGRQSVAKYAYLLNDNVFAGQDREIRGPYHSNGGIRMDGENQSLVTSAQPTWNCTESFGCSPPEEKPGVFTTTDNSQPDLFDFPVTGFDFAAITINLAQLKTLTEGGQGLYFAPSGKEGYHIILKENRSIDVWKVKEVTMLDNICTTVGPKVICDGGSCEPECPECQRGRCVVEDPVISQEEPLGNFIIPEDCPVVFFEDHLWVGKEEIESKIKGKITVISADLTDPAKDTDIWLQGDIEYTTTDGSDGLTLIAQRNNLIGYYSPNYMELKGIFIAQKGHFGRNLYWWDIKESLEMHGSIISNGRVGTQWTSGSSIVSGYKKRENYVDQNLFYNPPPYTPFVTSQVKIVGWEEVE